MTITNANNVLADGRISNLCLEGYKIPSADTYLSSQSINSYCLEGTNMVFQKGQTPWMKGRHHTEESKQKSSEAHKGCIAWNKGWKGCFSEETRKKISDSLKGNKIWLGKKHSDESKKKMSEAKKDYVPWIKGKHLSVEQVQSMTGANHVHWKGGAKLSRARSKGKKTNRGFILLTTKKPYNEPIVYHHIHPELPYVVPCPLRIHNMFTGSKKVHFDNVNAMLGVKLGVELLQ